MRCNECARRNSPSTRFCLHCGYDMNPTNSKGSYRKLTPPQESFFNRSYQGSTIKGWVYPGFVVLIGTLVITFGAYYWFVYSDSFQILAVDYDRVENINDN